MGRKKRKQDRKAIQRQEATNRRIDKIARAWSKSIARLPDRKHRGDTFIHKGKTGCIPFGGLLNEYSYCFNCWALKFCEKRKEIKWELKNGKLTEKEEERMEIKRKDVSFVSEWRPILGGRIYARLVFSDWKTDWIVKDCRDIKKAEVVSDLIFKILSARYL